VLGDHMTVCNHIVLGAVITLHDKGYTWLFEHIRRAAHDQILTHLRLYALLQCNNLQLDGDCNCTTRFSTKQGSQGMDQGRGATTNQTSSTCHVDQ